jgi:uroporphyrinogen decarboxylase
MTLTPKERMRRAVRHEPIDHLPTQINYTTRLGQKLAEYFQVTVADLPAFLGNHMLRVDLSFPQKYSLDGKIAYDWWGVGFDTAEEGYFTAHNPLQDIESLAQFAWPDPTEEGLLAEAAAALAADQGQHFITCNFGFCLFERAWALRGFQQFLLDMALNPAFAEELLDRITAIQLTLIRRFIDLGVDAGYFGDDYGSQKNLLFSPQTWRSLIKPRLAQMFTPFLEAGLPILMHSDGVISEILPDLVEIGLTTLNPVQPEVLDHTWLRQTFGMNLSYYGGISTQTVLPNGSPEEVAQAVMDCRRLLAPDHTGLVIAPSHRMMTDIPLEIIAVLLDTFTHLRS